MKPCIVLVIFYSSCLLFFLQYEGFLSESFPICGLQCTPNCCTPALLDFSGMFMERHCHGKFQFFHWYVLVNDAVNPHFEDFKVQGGVVRVVTFSEENACTFPPSQQLTKIVDSTDKKNVMEKAHHGFCKPWSRWLFPNMPWLIECT